MKRFLIAMALVVFMTGMASAEGMIFGVKGGLNLANISGDDAEGNAMKIAFGGGVWLNYAITEAFSVQPELMYMIKGCDSEEEDGGTLKFQYVDIDLLARYTIPMEGKFAPYFFAGPYISMLMSADAEMGDDSADIKDYMESMDYGAMIGVGGEYKLEQGCITFDARYALGLAKLAKDDEASLEFFEMEEAPDFKNTGIMVMVGYGFAF